MGIFKSRKSEYNSKASASPQALLAEAYKTYSSLPHNLRVDLKNRISKALNEFGPRKMRRRGLGTEFYEVRDFRPGQDDPRKINARLKARLGRDVVIEKEGEIRQHFYFWRDGSDSMRYKSDKALYSKKDTAEIMMMAFAQHLVKNEDLAGVLGLRGVHRGGRAGSWLSTRINGLPSDTRDRPVMLKKPPPRSTAVLFSDCYQTPAELDDTLSRLRAADLTGFLVMVLDPQEIEFDFQGAANFTDAESGQQTLLEKVEETRGDYRSRMINHVKAVRDIAEKRGFQFILQRTDEPVLDGILQMYGLKNLKPKLGPDAPGPGL